MYKIVRKQELNASVTLMEIEAPFVARKAKAGQFIIFRIDEMGERVPLTIAGYDREKGTVTIIFQKVGFSTNALGALKEGDYIHDFVGPLGKPTPVEGKKKVCVVGGGVGCAIALPSAKAFKEAGAEVTVIVGFRSKDIVILEDEFKAAADRLILMTDDGTYGRHGLVTQPLQELLEAGETFDEVLAIGPVPMMKFVCRTTQPFGVHTILTSKYGKTKCATAKVVAGIITAILTTTLIAAFNLLLAFVFYGTEGLDCSILFAPSDYVEAFIPFNITCGTLLKYQILLAFTCTLSVTGITLFLSAISKNQIVALVAAMAIFLFPVLLPITEVNPLFRLVGLLPIYHVLAISLLSVEQMSNGMLYAIWAIPAALLFLGVGAGISRRVFAKHQVL